MANKYSTLYTTPADQPNGPRTYKGPTAAAKQTGVTAVCQISGAVGNGDVLYLRGGLVPGEYITAIDMAHTVDSNITTANLVLRPTDGSADITLLSGSALLDGTVNTTAAWTALAATPVPDNGKDYDLCWVAGAAGAASVHTFIIRSALGGN